MWDLPGPGLEPVSPALAWGFLTTVPPGKPHPGPFLSWESEPNWGGCGFEGGGELSYGSSPTPSFYVRGN